YSVKALKPVSVGGKGTNYIVPLQETLDTSPLPPDSQHFSKIEEMPLQMLAVHIKTCKGKYFDETDEVRAFFFFLSCSLSMEDVLHFLKEQVDTTTEFKLCVDREDLLDRAIIQWQRKKAASPTSALKVGYIGEAGVDTGAIRKEFLSDMISGIEKRFFEGHGIQGKNPKYSLTDLDNENFRTIGEIIAVSLAQGGPAPAFLKEWCYTFLCRGEMDINCLSKEDVADLESSLLISRVNEQSLILWADDIVSSGYTSQIKLDNKEIKGILFCIYFKHLFVSLYTLQMGRLIMQLVKSQSLEVQHVLQWMTGQGHIPILPDEKRNFKIIFKFDHKCRERLGDHSICYPVVSACTSTVTFPVQHLNTYSEFRSIMGEAVRYGGGFHRV
uniref:HECT domain-containing protein n=1 Tax=Paramormyrops kingsleyae TaxID=1676925 RepID=A0A3B3QCL9_9TELE